MTGKPARFWAATALILALMLLGLVWQAPISSRPEAQQAQASDTQGTKSDVELYRLIAADVAEGKPYHASAIARQRANNYPVAPFVTVRPPTLAWLMASVEETEARLLFLALALTAILGWGWRARSEAAHGATRIAVPMAALLSFLVLTGPNIMHFHEAWAGVLLMLGLALWSPTKPWTAIACMVLATLFREMALAALLFMAAAAIWEKRWRELIGWSIGLALACAWLVWHALSVHAHLLPGDPRSQGWDGLGGWPFLLDSVRVMTPLASMATWASALLVPLMLAGWLAWGTPRSWRALGLITGFGMALMLFARPANFYWALLVAPLLFTGLGLLPLIPSAFRRTTA